MSDKTTSAFIVSSFKDAGTEKEFTAGAITPIEDGSFKNYKAAGLVREPTAEELKAAAKVASADDSKATGKTAA